MALDLRLKSATLDGLEGNRVDIGIARGRIAAIEQQLTADCETIDIGGNLVMPGFVETHITGRTLVDCSGPVRFVEAR